MGFDGWNFVSPSWSWWGYLKFIRIRGHESGFVNIDVKCTECGNKEWEVHDRIDTSFAGSMDVGPNLYALTGGVVFGPYVGIGTQVIIAESVALKFEYDLLKSAHDKSGAAIRLLMKYGPTVICYLSSQKS